MQLEDEEFVFPKDTPSTPRVSFTVDARRKGLTRRARSHFAALGPQNSAHNPSWHNKEVLDA